MTVLTFMISFADATSELRLPQNVKNKVTSEQKNLGNEPETNETQVGEDFQKSGFWIFSVIW